MSLQCLDIEICDSVVVIAVIVVALVFAFVVDIVLFVSLSVCFEDDMRKFEFETARTSS